MEKTLEGTYIQIISTVFSYYIAQTSPNLLGCIDPSARLTIPLVKLIFDYHTKTAEALSDRSSISRERN